MRRGEESLDREGVNGGASEGGKNKTRTMCCPLRDETFSRRKKSISIGGVCREVRSDGAWLKPAHVERLLWTKH